ncbi:C4-type zinc ribbon domain-containing protein [Desulfonema limicola]|uniref:C4-type zinc ribbon domain-containing protein n=1 Tax=Desulfonema limicola TaxID=45656 RepID=A0A975GHW5_9BACT|nr:C4-type zinc ribbon domain-containing protein [Desulfonema limicola]QTA81990.1 C4-type zinc ribbon domain-containing protein [Desulfonema limicola]
MKEQIETLVKLQKIETETNHINTILNEVSNKINSLDTRLSSYEISISQAEESLNILKKKYRDLETDIDMNNQTINKGKDRLNGVKTNKEYQALLKGIDELNKKNFNIEEEMLTLMDQIEQTQNDIDKQKDEYENLKQEVHKEKQSIIQGSRQAQKKLSELDNARGKISAMIAPDLLKKFQMIKDQIPGPAIVPIKGIVCEGCNMNIPPQMRNDLKKFESLKFCPFCYRLIYWEEQKTD